MRSLLQSLALCLMWFTRIPLPGKIADAQRLQQQSLAWLPGIGILLGTLAIGLVDILSGFPIWVAALCALAFTTWLSGALHEDGWADGWDALGAGGDSAHKLRILKDPRLGTYGVTALVFSFALQGAGLVILYQHGKADLFVLAHAASRFPLSWIAWKIPYVRQNQEGKANFLRQKAEPWAWFVWMLWIPLFVGLSIENSVQFILVGITAALVSLFTILPWKRSLGGVTGDLFGFCQQAGLLAGLLVALWGTR